MSQTSKKNLSDRVPSEAEKREQGKRCGCNGADDMCDCQNAVLQDSRRARSLRVEAEKRERTEVERERDRLRDVIERDRTKTAEIIGGIRAVVGRWSWLGEGRGSYAWDDDRYQDEFRQMLDALKEATDPLRALAADWTDCPQDYQAARIDWKAHSAALARALAFYACKCPDGTCAMSFQNTPNEDDNLCGTRARSLLAPKEDTANG